MEEAITCVECGRTLESGAIACRYCEDRHLASDRSIESNGGAVTSILEIRRNVRRAWGIMAFGLIILQPILQPANVLFAISTLIKAQRLYTREPGIERQLVLIAALSGIFSVLFWILLLQVLGLL